MVVDLPIVKYIRILFFTSAVDVVSQRQAVFFAQSTLNETCWLQSQYRCKGVFVYQQWCEENEMVFVSHEVPFPAMSDKMFLKVNVPSLFCQISVV